MSTTYTAKEVVEILQEAKKLGVISMKLVGFEAAFAPQIDHEKITYQAPQVDERKFGNQNLGYCDKCNASLIEGNWGPYCKPCHLKRKEQNWHRGQKAW